MSKGILGYVTSLSVFIMGCGATLIDPNQADTADQHITHDPCTDNQTRCQGSSYQTCERGVFQQQQRCADSEICDPAWSCVASNGCGSGADLIYVLDDMGTIHSFDPSTGLNEFRTVGEPSCSYILPDINSMSVDRHAQAWLSTHLGEVYQVDLRSLTCKRAAVSPASSSYTNFGMGFSTNEVGTSNESLFIAGGTSTLTTSGRLARIDPNLLSVATVGTLPELGVSPELTGTGAGDLFGYYPVAKGAVVAQIDKATARHLHSWTLAPLSGAISAWAFAHWGGQLYIFVTAGQNSQVQLFDPKTEKSSTLISNLTFQIVGAGVSTCAPLEVG